MADETLTPEEAAQAQLAARQFLREMGFLREFPGVVMHRPQMTRRRRPDAVPDSAILTTTGSPKAPPKRRNTSAVRARCAVYRHYA